jgi:adenosine deaminase
MSMESYIQAMPKVELGLQLEGTVPRQTLVMIAEQNEIPSTTKGYKDLVSQLDKPNYEKLPELLTTVSQWIRYPDDLSRVVYDTGVALARQNVRYAEIGVNPLLYMNHTNMSFEQLIEAMNDGRDKAQRGWNVRLNWILNIPREEPRRGDDVVRWAQSATGRKYGVVGLGLTGREESQPAAQFERPFKTAEKKSFPRVIHAGDKLAAEAILDTLEHLLPTRIIGGWGAADAPDVIKRLADQNVLLAVCMARQLCLGRIQTYADYPLRWLYDQDVKVTLTSHMPALYKTTITDEYTALVVHNDFLLEELEEIALNAVRYSALIEDEQAEMLKNFKAEYAKLRVEHLEEATT